ncbi:MAG: M1 family metallopeptidase [Chloroflexi bacterium]|nr:M1 family metallopeptidase [Chloroflexota bacterium]
MMKRKTLTIIISFMILAINAACQSEESTQELGESSQETIELDVFDTAWDDRALFNEGLIDSEQDILDGFSGASVYHIDFQISEDFTRLEGREEVLYTNQEDVSLDEIYFRLFPNISGGVTTISGLTADGQDVAPVYESEESALRVNLPEALEPGEDVVLGLDFEVELALEMGGNYGLFGFFEGVLVLDLFYPAIPVDLPPIVEPVVMLHQQAENVKSWG